MKYKLESEEGMERLTEKQYRALWIDLVEESNAQQQEIDQLKQNLKTQEAVTMREMGKVKALTADKDEQAGQIMRMDNGLKKLRSSLRWLKETIHDLDYKAWAEDNIGKIDALLGGKEDEN